MREPHLPPNLIEQEQRWALIAKIEFFEGEDYTERNIDHHIKTALALFANLPHGPC